MRRKCVGLKADPQAFRVDLKADPRNRVPGARCAAAEVAGATVL